mgnify:CR=1 FL=1
MKILTLYINFDRSIVNIKATNVGLHRWRSYRRHTYCTRYITLRLISVWQSRNCFVCMQYWYQPSGPTKLGLHCWKLSSNLISLSGVLSAVESGLWAIFFPVSLDTALIFDKTQCLVNHCLPLASYSGSNGGADVNTGQ